MTTRAAYHGWASARRAPGPRPATMAHGEVAAAPAPADDAGSREEGDIDGLTAAAAYRIPTEAELVALGLPPAPPAYLVASVLRQVHRAELPAYRRWLARAADLCRLAR